MNIKEIEASFSDRERKVYESFDFGSQTLYCKYKANGLPKFTFISLSPSQKQWKEARRAVGMIENKWFFIVKSWMVKPITQSRARELTDMAEFKANKR